MGIETDMLIEAGYDLIEEYSATQGISVKYVGSQAFFDDPGLVSEIEKAGYTPQNSNAYYSRRFGGIIRAAHKTLVSSLLWTMYRSIIEKLGEDFNYALRNDWVFIQGEVERVSGDLIQIVDHIEEEISQEVNTVFETVVEATNETSQETTEAIDGLSEKIDAVKDVLVDYYDDKLAELDQAVAESTASAQQYTDTKIMNLNNKITDINDDITSNLAGQIKGVYDQIDTTKTGLLQTMAGAVDTINKSISDVKDTMLETYETGLADIVGKLKDVQDLAGKIAKPLFDIKSKLIEYFMEIVAQVFEKITENIPEIKF